MIKIAGLLGLLLPTALLLPFGARAEKPRETEEQMFSTARALFDDHQYPQAAAKLTNFLAAYTNSPNVPYATLYLARSLIEQSNYTVGIDLLTNGIARSGDLAGEYVFWIASGRLQNGQAAEAAEGFGNLIRNFPATPRKLEAACDEAEAWEKMENYPRVIELLQNPQGAFRLLATADSGNIFTARGNLLLAEALMAQHNYAEGAKVVAGVNPAGLTPEWQWRRLYLLCQLQLAGGRAAEALQSSTNLLDTASGPRHVAASLFLRGQILEALRRPDDALTCYTNNLADALPSEIVRQALLKVVQVTLGANQIPDAVQLLENYVVQHTNSPALDLARLSLGELYLRLYFNPPPLQKGGDVPVIVTNYLQGAVTNFDSVIHDFPSSPLAAQAHLDRGWCYWAMTNLAGAETNFQVAADHLQPSMEQAVARFKLADTEFSRHDYAAAVTNYNLLLTQYAGVENVTNTLFDQALYQLVQASLARGDAEGAQSALRRILTEYPNSLFGDRGQLVVGEFSRYDYAMARRVFSDLIQRSPHTPLLPEVEYAIARTYEQEGNWGEALRQYEHWLAAHSKNASNLVPQVEFSRALAYGKMDLKSNALALFTNFVVRFPAHPLAPWAQNWVADYYYNLGDNQSAEGNYELLYQKFPNAGDLAYQARLMAGRAALARQDDDEARQYFADLVTNTSAPSNLVSEAWFALGDSILQQFQANPGSITNLDQAVAALSNLTNSAPTNAIAAQAYGRLGDYYMEWADLQWATKREPLVYTKAAQMYEAVTNFPASTAEDISTRSEAEVALGRIAEHQNRPDLALNHYTKVLYDDEVHFDPFWVEQAGFAAAQLYQRQKQSDKAIQVYRRVLKAVPSLSGPLEKAILAAQADEIKAKN